MHGGDFILEVGGGDWASHMMEQSGESGLWKNTMAK